MCLASCTVLSRVADSDNNGAETLKRVFGANLRTYRTSRGLSQMRLAELLELDQRYYSGIERGEWNLTFETVGRITDSLGVDPLELLQGKQ